MDYLDSNSGFAASMTTSDGEDVMQNGRQLKQTADHVTINRFQGTDDFGNEWWLSKVIGGGFALRGIVDGIEYEARPLGFDFVVNEQGPLREELMLVTQTSPIFCTVEDMVDPVLSEQTTSTAIDLGCDNLDGPPVPVGDPTGDDTDVAGNKMTIYFGNDMSWCMNRGEEGWAATVGNVFGEVEAAFKATGVKSSGWYAVCWFALSGSFSHNVDYHHKHDDGSTGHKYPYNPVTSDHYCYSGGGVSGYMNLLGSHLTSARNHFSNVPDSFSNRQTLHQRNCFHPDANKNVAGVGDQGPAGSKSIARTITGLWASSHELGHNWDATHGEAECVSETVTLMAGSGTPCSWQGKKKLNEFSADNIERINSYAGVSVT